MPTALLEPTLIPYHDTITIDQTRHSTWDFAKGDSITAKAWAKQWWIEAKRETYFDSFLSESNSIITVIT
jgi:hypothetical protein